MRLSVQEKKKHHIVAKSISERFANADGKLWLFDRRFSDRGVFARTPVEAIVQNKLYTFENSAGNPDWSLEDRYADLEAKIKPIIDKFLIKVKNKKSPSLTQEEKRLWDTFYYRQQKRTPDVFEFLGLPQIFQQNIELYIQWFESEFRKLSNDEKEDLRRPETIKKIKQQAATKARAEGGHKVEEAFSKTGIIIGTTKSQKISFIIGDHSIIKLPRKVADNNPICAFWFPISPHVAVRPGNKATSEKLISVDRDIVRKINESLYSTSNVIASGSKELVVSLSKKEQKKQ